MAPADDGDGARADLLDDGRDAVEWAWSGSAEGRVARVFMSA